MVGKENAAEMIAFVNETEGLGSNDPRYYDIDGDLDLDIEYAWGYKGTRAVQC